MCVLCGINHRIHSSSANPENPTIDVIITTIYGSHITGTKGVILWKKLKSLNY